MPLTSIDPTGDKKADVYISMTRIIDQILFKMDKVYYSNMDKYYKYLINKFNDISEILCYLQKKININSLGTIVVNYYYNKKLIPNDNILKFISLCCLPFYYSESNIFYVNDITIDELSVLWPNA